MKKNQDLFSITSDILLNLKDILGIEKPDLVMVHGGHNNFNGCCT